MTDIFRPQLRNEKCGKHRIAEDKHTSSFRVVLPPYLILLY